MGLPKIKMIQVCQPGPAFTVLTMTNVLEENLQLRQQLETLLNEEERAKERVIVRS